MLLVVDRLRVGEGIIEGVERESDGEMRANDVEDEAELLEGRLEAEDMPLLVVVGRVECALPVEEAFAVLRTKEDVEWSVDEL